MTIMTRLGQMFKADIHAVLDMMEEPNALLKQAVRDMETDLQARQQQLDILLGQSDQLQHQLKDQQHLVNESKRELQLCLENENDELARHFIRRQLEGEKTANWIEGRDQQLQQAISSLEKALHDDKLRYESLRQKAELLEKTSSQERSNQTCRDGFQVSDEDVEVALLRARQQGEAS
jgi:phage shock protein A